jgi:hypothetical protein
MNSATQTLISMIAAAVAAVAAVFALMIAAIALFVARSTPREARSTTEAQRETLHATQTAVVATTSLVGRIETSTRVLHLIFGEAQATRELEQLRRVADQVAQLIRYRRAVKNAFLEHNPPPWFDHNDAQMLLAAHLEGLPAEDLPKTHEMVTADPRHTDGLDDQALYEIKHAIATARARLDELTASASKELSRGSTSSRAEGHE